MKNGKKTFINNITRFNQTCLQHPRAPLGPQNCDFWWQLVVIQNSDVPLCYKYWKWDTQWLCCRLVNSNNCTGKFGYNQHTVMPNKKTPQFWTVFYSPILPASLFLLRPWYCRHKIHDPLRPWRHLWTTPYPRLIADAQITQQIIYKKRFYLVSKKFVSEVPLNPKLCSSEKLKVENPCLFHSLNVNLPTHSNMLH